MTINLGAVTNFGNIEQEMESAGGDFSAMEPHENTFVIANCEAKQGNESSVYVEAVFDIVGEKYNGRKIWMNYYLIKKDGTENPVARAEYGRLCKACGVVDPQMMLDPNNLLGKMVSAMVKVAKSTGYDDKNEIKNPKAIGGVAAPMQTQQQPVQQQYQQPVQQQMQQQQPQAQYTQTAPVQQAANPFANKS